MKRIYTDFDLPTNHLGAEGHFVPPKARDAAEIDRRRGLRAGTLLAEFQARGMTMSALIMGAVHELPDVKFAAKVLAVSGMNSAWYGFARGAEARVMRRRIKLPTLDAGPDEVRPNVISLLPRLGEGMTESVAQAHVLVAANERMPAKAAEHAKRLGRSVGENAIALACLANPEGIEQFVGTEVDFDAQNFVRQRGLWALHHSRTLLPELGSYPSIAQLAHPDSDLSVYWRRNAPDGALEAYEEAQTSPLVA